ncbi:hypothetical protein GCM10018789_30140 [Streptomyces werraensis]|nr:hypothetical protein GCM10018789_30140 [Streptomyces werraensis]
MWTRAYCSITDIGGPLTLRRAPGKASMAYQPFTHPCPIVHPNRNPRFRAAYITDEVGGKQDET